MKKLYQIVCSCFFYLVFNGLPVQAQAPNFAWAKQALGNPTQSSTSGNAIAIDAAGNTYVTGSFDGSTTFGTTTLTNVSGANNSFLVKYNTAGNVLWARRIGAGVYDVAVDGAGNPHITGGFQGSLTLGTTTLTSSGGEDIFIAKYDVSGTVQWAQRAGGVGEYDAGYGIDVDGSGNVYVIGEFQGTAAFGSSNITSEAGSSDIFVAKFNNTGTALWARRAGGASGDYGNAIAVDGTGNAYVTGEFQGNATFGSTTLTSNGEEDIFIAKYDASGTMQWARRAGNISDDSGRAIAVDGAGNVYLTGEMEGNVTFGSTTLTSIGDEDVFVVKYDAAGTVLWARKAGGTDSEYGEGIAVDGSGNVYVTGEYYGAATFGSTTLPIGNAGEADMFVVKYDAAGNVLWARKAGGGKDTYGNGITLDGTGNAYVTGNFEEEATFGTTRITSGGRQDLFLAKYNASGTVQWVQNAGGGNFNYGRSIAVDGNRNSYVTGYFTGSITFGNTVLTSGGEGYDGYIAKYDATGNLLWAKKMLANGSGYSYSIVVDGAGNAYVAGEYSGTASFGSTTLNSNGNWNLFVAKYDTNGNALWAKDAGGTGSMYGNGIGLDGTGNIYVAGGFQGSATIGNTTVTSAGNRDVLVVKYNAAGTAVWAKSAGGAEDDYTRGFAVDGAGNLSVTGYFSGAATFGATTLTSVGAQDIFVARYDANGNALWAHNGGGAFGDAGYGVALDNSGNTYVTGVFQSTATFGATTLTGSGSFDVFLLKYNSAGNLLWARRAGGTSYDDGLGVAVDGAGSVFVTGTFQGSAVFGNTTLTSAGGYDMFIAKYDAAGVAQWAQKAGGAGLDESRGIAVDGLGSVYITGYIQQPVTFGATTLSKNGNGYDIFVAKLGNGPTSVKESQLAASLLVYPNPTRGQISFTLPLSGRTVVETRLLDSKGQVLQSQRFTAGSGDFQQTLTLKDQAAGVYFLQIITNGEVITRRVVKQ
ncbi:SBBP repeat-containing protein [Rufibacter sp. LB8]|uniref:SBBP repeat-containing protein n=1 Tax=Rufibacter sp. LB8 TaxID=2777781 RepID=UPI00178C6173|nr:SBBP repeat-containing protein [Rufibacter sp. LB8]